MPISIVLNTTVVFDIGWVLWFPICLFLSFTSCMCYIFNLRLTSQMCAELNDRRYFIREMCCTFLCFVLFLFLFCLFRLDKEIVSFEHRINVFQVKRTSKFLQKLQFAEKTNEIFALAMLLSLCQSMQFIYRLTTIHTYCRVYV